MRGCAKSCTLKRNPHRAMPWTAAVLACGWCRPNAVKGEVKFDHYLPSKWNTVSPGVYGSEYAPVLKIASGETVKIDIANTSGVRNGDPRKFFVDNIFRSTCRSSRTSSRFARRRRIIRKACVARC